MDEMNTTSDISENSTEPPVEMVEQSYDAELEKLKAQQNPKFNCEGTLFTFFGIFGVVFMSFLLIFQIWLTPIQVVGRSMMPTINVSATSDKDEEHCDIVYYNKDSSYQNDDIVIVSNEQNQYINDKDVDFFIKRVIACPGQTIVFYLTEVSNTGLVRNYYYDVLVKDSSGNTISLDDSYKTEEMFFTSTEYIFSESSWFKQLFAKIANDSLDLEERKAEISLKENEYFVMGDNRNHSDDSRVLGLISYSDISGKVKLHIPYGKSLIQAIWIKLKSLF